MKKNIKKRRKVQTKITMVIKMIHKKVINNIMMTEIKDYIIITNKTMDKEGKTAKKEVQQNLIIKFNTFLKKAAAFLSFKRVKTIQIKIINYNNNNNNLLNKIINKINHNNRKIKNIIKNKIKKKEIIIIMNKINTSKRRIIKMILMQNKIYYNPIIIV